MNIKINREELLPVLTRVSNVVEKRQTLPILANLFIKLENCELTVVGTDLEVEITQQLTGIKGNNTEFTVSMRKMLDICRVLPQNSIITLKEDKDNIRVESSSSRYTLKTLPAPGYPRIETGLWQERLKIKQIDFKKLLDNTAFAMAIQDVRFFLNGLLFELSNNNLRAIATDGHRLARSDVDITLATHDVRQLIIPRKAINEIQRLLAVDSDPEAELIIEISHNHLKLTKNNTVLITKLIDGKYPEFKDILETELKTILNINRLELLEALSRAAVLTTDRFNGVRIMLNDNFLRVTAHNPEQEEAVEEMVISYEKEKVETGYNVSYMIDALRVIGSEQIEMHMGGNDSLCIFIDPADDKSIWLTMPMRM